MKISIIAKFEFLDVDVVLLVVFDLVYEVKLVVSNLNESANADEFDGEPNVLLIKF